MNPHEAVFEQAFGLGLQLPEGDLPEVAFCGRSNVGKSSLLNRILNRKSLARVSAVPGKTATINFYRAGDVRLVDLPGYGYAKVAKGERRRFGELIDSYFSQNRYIAMVFVLVDMRHPPSGDDSAMLSALIEGELPTVVVLTKSDKLSRTEREKRLGEIRSQLPFGDDLVLVPFSAVTGEGAEQLIDIINEVTSPQENEEE